MEVDAYFVEGNEAKSKSEDQHLFQPLIAAFANQSGTKDGRTLILLCSRREACQREMSMGIMEEKSSEPSSPSPFDAADHLRWAETEFKQLDLHSKLAFEYRKLATDFSKLMLSSLVAINSGGLVSLPAIALFLGLSDTNTRYHVFVLPALCYVSGVVAALGGVLSTYYNFDLLSQFEAVNADLRISDIRRFRAMILGLENIRVSLTGDIVSLLNKQTALNKRIRRTYLGGHILGWASLLGFISGGIAVLAKHLG